MNKTSTIIVSVIILGLLATSILYFSGFIGKNSEEATLTTEEKDKNSDEMFETVTAFHQYSDNKHIVAGEISLPTPCHILETNALIAESYPEQVTINLTTRTEAEICAQVITPARFMVEFTASEEAKIRATLNNKNVILNLIPAPEGEDLMDFELFIKG